MRHSRALGLALAALGILLGSPSRAVADGSAPEAAPAPRLTVERIFAGPRYTGGGVPLDSWEPRREAWVEWRGDRDERALWSVDAVSGEATKLVALTELNDARPQGPEVPMVGIGRGAAPSLVWAPDGNRVFLSLHGDLYAADLPAGKRVRVTRTTSPISDVRVSPDGAHVSFCRANDLWASVLEADGAREVRLTQGGSETLRNASLDWLYPEELGCTTAAWWSPDSTRVAFLRLDESAVPTFPLSNPIPTHGAVRSLQYPKAGDPNPVASVHVVGLDGKPPLKLDLGADPDVYVPWAAWWPDGKRVGVAVLDRAQQRFDLKLCDAAGGPPTVAWHEEDPQWVDVPSPPKFLEKTAAFLLRSRRDGWWRLYLVPLDGKEPKALTPVGSEVGSILAVDEAAGTVTYDRRSDDRLRNEVFRVSLAGGEPVRVSQDGLSHGASFAPTGTLWLDTASRACSPPRVTLRRADGKPVRDLADARTKEYDALGLHPPQFVTLPADDGTPLSAVVYKPRDFDPTRKYPVIVPVYGGPSSSMVSDDFGNGSLFNHLLAQEGFVVLSIDGRGTGNRGKAFEAGIHRRLGALELADQVAGVRALAKEPWVDATRVGIWGWSYGGTMAAYAMAHAPDTFRAAVAVAPVTDWRLYDTIYTERYMDLPSENEDGYRGAAVTTFAKDIRGALLLCHGLSDDNVHAQNTLRLAQALVQARRPFDLMLYPERAHGIEGTNEHVHLFSKILEHFRRNL